jgi:hypothetical protein
MVWDGLHVHVVELASTPTSHHFLTVAACSAGFRVWCQGLAPDTFHTRSPPAFHLACWLSIPQFVTNWVG